MFEELGNKKRFFGSNGCYLIALKPIIFILLNQPTQHILITVISHLKTPILDKLIAECNLMIILSEQSSFKCQVPLTY